MFKTILSFFKSSFRSRKSLNDIVNKSLFSDELKRSFALKNFSEDFFKLMEAELLKADIGVKTTEYFLTELANHKFTKNADFEEVKSVLAKLIIDSIKDSSSEIVFDRKPIVILFSGVNGSGKTTSIGKIAYLFAKQGKKILMVAGDSFRAAATEQLKVWSEKAKCELIIPSKIGDDPAALAYKAVERAMNENFDLVLIDTAGRLQNQKNLMDELNKIIRVVKKLDPTAPHFSFLVIDATAGQNASKQVEIFKEQAQVNGLILSKMDGTAKGGIAISLLREQQIPIYFMATGEKASDLQKFNPSDFVQNIFHLSHRAD